MELVSSRECHPYLARVAMTVTSSLSGGLHGGRVVQPASDLSLRTLADAGIHSEKVQRSEETWAPNHFLSPEALTVQSFSARGDA